MTPRSSACVLIAVMLLGASRADATDQGSSLVPATKSQAPQADNRGRNIQRTMTLLATSTPQKRNTVKILFYGRSITEQS